MERMFKLVHPSDILTRVFMLEYMRELGPVVLYSKANKHQKESMFYRFLAEELDEQEHIDLNWEALIFECTMHQLEGLLNLFDEEIMAIEVARLPKMEQRKKEIEQEKIATPMDINLMDFAASQMNPTKGKILGLDGFSI